MILIAYVDDVAATIWHFFNGSVIIILLGDTPRVTAGISTKFKDKM
jgi:hypothetical protein